MKVFIGILLLSGYHKLPQAHLYWDSNNDTTVTIVSNAMPRARFQLIKKYLHCVDLNELMYAAYKVIRKRGYNKVDMLGLGGQSNSNSSDSE